MAVIEKKGAYMEFPLKIKRQYGAPLDDTSVWYNLEEAKQYAKTGATAYVGQIVAVVNEDTRTVDIYKIALDGTLTDMGSKLDIMSESDAQGILDKHFNAIK